MRVKVYRNLNKGRTTGEVIYSIVAMEGPRKDRVIGYASEIQLFNCKFVVQPGGYNRVLRERRRNVHAWVIGHVPHTSSIPHITRACATRVSYSPMRGPNFLDAHGRQCIESLYVSLDSEGCWIS